MHSCLHTAVQDSNTAHTHNTHTHTTYTHTHTHLHTQPPIASLLFSRPQLPFTQSAGTDCGLQSPPFPSFPIQWRRPELEPKRCRLCGRGVITAQSSSHGERHRSLQNEQAHFFPSRAPSSFAQRRKLTRTVPASHRFPNTQASPHSACVTPSSKDASQPAFTPFSKDASQPTQCLRHTVFQRRKPTHTVPASQRFLSRPHPLPLQISSTRGAGSQPTGDAS